MDHKGKEGKQIMERGGYVVTKRMCSINIKMMMRKKEYKNFTLTQT